MSDGKSGMFPINSLHLQALLTNPEYRNEIPDDLKIMLAEQLTLDVVKSDTGENVQFDYKNNLWAQLHFYTKEFRLGNLTPAQVNYCMFYGDFGHDLLSSTYKKSFMACVSRMVSTVEMSQSRKGFLRKLLGTFTQQTVYKDASRKGVFGESKED